MTSKIQCPRFPKNRLDIEDNFSPSVLLFHVYAFGSWKEITRTLIDKHPFDVVYINISIDIWRVANLIDAWIFFLKYPRVKKVFITINNKKYPEGEAWKKFQKHIPWNEYNLMTYMHAKGVTKPNNRYIKDWVELMRYFLIDRIELCHKAFNNGFKLYGVNLGIFDSTKSRYGPFKFSDFHFAGNFITVNLTLLRDKIVNTPVDDDYFGVEGFWGKLCKSSEAYSAHISNVDHYQNPYPSHKYKDGNL